jgi:5,6-dimethylbenzimidazole synthase
MSPLASQFTDGEKAGLYRAIFERRDIRRFRPDPLPAAALAQILRAAHHAPSVGFMQPWAAFARANAEAVECFEGDRRQQYATLKLEGILEAPLNIAVTCDRNRFGPVVLGRTCQPDMDLYSTVCAVQNLWLAARAEGIGVGWVSIVHTEDLVRILELPSYVVPVAYLCLGYVDEFPVEPELKTRGWLPRLSIDQVLRFERWNETPGPEWDELRSVIK